MTTTGKQLHEQVLDNAPVSFVVTNPALGDNPIVFVNHAFTQMTGYSVNDCIGRNCRFLQGAESDPAAIALLRKAIEDKAETAVTLTNYRADGTAFANRVHIYPLWDDAGALEYFVGIYQETADSEAAEAEIALREIHHRVKNHLSMVVGMIRMQARAKNAASTDDYATLARRIETLQLLYQEMTMGGTDSVNAEDISLGAYVSRIASTIAYLDGRQSVRLNVDLDAAHTAVDTAAQIGLLVSELLTNTYQHAFKEQTEGLVEIRLKEQSEGGAIRLQVSDDGVGIDPEMNWPDGGNLGGKIIRSLLTGLGASMTVAGGNGTVLTIDIPQRTTPADAPA
ncbi:PAS domain-containing protein [Acuticoccus sp. MNP-M23]|uniref:PAS domain-containing protein n=1 Tax=Acuticoccus sp. MNP-M23 TaxID=3072793 RepID=UPI0028166D91|nr:PAS domain-containing protein [Acuticoccus sp. MNP-M23]WMS41617.1 PAS domain-containing protein [Acuticoccus sp. MNP-M23]